MFECVDNIRVCNKFIIPIYSIICKKEKQLYFVFLIQYKPFVEKICFPIKKVFLNSDK